MGFKFIKNTLYVFKVKNSENDGAIQRHHADSPNSVAYSIPVKSASLIDICDAPHEKGTLGQNFRYWVFTGFWKRTVLGAIWCKNLRNILSGSGENSIFLF